MNSIEQEERESNEMEDEGEGEGMRRGMTRKSGRETETG